MKNYIVALGAVVCLMGLFLVRGSFMAKQEDALVVGVLSGYEPFCVINAQGELEGFDIDVAKQLAGRMNKKVIFKDMSLASLFVAVRQNKIDLLLSSLSITPERERQMAMVYYYGEPTTTFPLVFWESIPQGVSGIDSLVAKKATVCVEPGSSQEAYLQQFEDQLTIKRVASITDIVMELRYGKAQAALMDPEVIDTLVAQAPSVKVMPVALPAEFQSKGAGIAINKDNQILIDEVARTINDLRVDGIIQDLEQQWLQKEQS